MDALQLLLKSGKKWQHITAWRALFAKY